MQQSCEFCEYQKNRSNQVNDILDRGRVEIRNKRNSNALFLNNLISHSARSSHIYQTNSLLSRGKISVPWETVGHLQFPTFGETIWCKLWNSTTALWSLSSTFVRLSFHQIRKYNSDGVCTRRSLGTCRPTFPDTDVCCQYPPPPYPEVEKLVTS